ncbi:MAG: Stk1 family PASTA domain-containing Ser/Thr kinase, partial [Armatimonadetes bacterium]|nr:Stk1 family PASTA domain-containing Ser/Thr kinase [Armatimonadota bacterium]
MTLSERYQVHERIGEGGMALVYRATDLRLSRSVAIKMLRPQFANDPEFVARFEQEARAAAGLTHPHIASVFDTGEDGEKHYIVMELLHPFTLKDLIARNPNGRLAPDEAARIAGQIASALALAHQKGVVHRDIKPQNILFTDDGLVKVTDFGIARALAAASGTATGTILGSPHYISPEQASGQPAGPASDLYSLGVVLYEMLSGKPPYAGETPIAIAVQHLRSSPAPLASLVPGLPPQLLRVVEKATARDPAQRFASAEQFRQALAGAPVPDDLAQTTVMPALAGAVPAVSEVDHEPDPEPYRRQPPRRRLTPGMLVLLGLLVGLAAVVGTVVSLRHEPEAPEENPAVEISPAKPIQAPNLIGQDVDAARAWVEQDFASRQLIPPQVVESERRDGSAAANQILEQTPAPGTTMDEGGIIRVVVCTGRIPTKVPELTGLTIDRAKTLLQESGLMLGNVSHAHSETYVADIVMSQSAAAESEVPEGTAVDLEVSLGPRDTAPAVPTP